MPVNTPTISVKQSKPTISSTNLYTMSARGIGVDVGGWRAVPLRVQDSSEASTKSGFKIAADSRCDTSAVARWLVQGARSAGRPADVLKQLCELLARITEIYGLRRSASILLDTYVGHQAGERILAGRIRRGDYETISAVIWLSDMRGFTALADTLPPAVLIELLNSYFDCQVPEILDCGGEILKFMGDGMLAIFPVASNAADLPKRAERRWR
jgi:hypothetical protein